MMAAGRNAVPVRELGRLLPAVVPEGNDIMNSLAFAMFGGLNYVR